MTPSEHEREKNQEPQGRYVLWLPSWYPEPLNAMNGDFIQRHAEAVAIHQKIQVVYVVRDPLGTITKGVERTVRQKGNLTETIIHYYIKPSPVAAFEKLISFSTAQKLYRKEISGLFAKHGLPSLVHAYIAYKSGLVALWVKRKWGIPYVITEQWTLYLKEADVSFEQLNFLVKRQFKRIFAHASGVSVVSKYLGDRLKQLFGLKNYTVIPNVVNTELFYPSVRKPSDVVRFTHISVLNYQKDPENMLKAFSIVKNTHPNFHLTIIGPGFENWQAFTSSLGLNDHVTFTGELPNSALGETLRRSDALVLYSRYETFGCVLIEANACGVPVIVSDIPVFHENIKEGLNGTFARKEDAGDLARKISQFMENRSVFNRDLIVAHTKESYNYQSVGGAFLDWYKSCLLG